MIITSDNQNDGTYNGTLYQQPGMQGYALGFDGTDDTVSTSIENANRPTDTFSFGGWMKTPVTERFAFVNALGTSGCRGRSGGYGDERLCPEDGR